MYFEKDDLDIIATSLLMTIISADRYESTGSVLDLDSKRVVDRARELLKKIKGV